MTILYWLDQITPEQQAIVGQKAFSLSQIKRAGYPVVSGFVIPSSTLEEFLFDLHYDFANLNVDDYQALQIFASESRQQILRLTFPEEFLSDILAATSQLCTTSVALRPSLCVSNSLFGDWNQFLSTQFCPCNPSALSLGIKQTWAELFRAKTLFLAQKHQIKPKDLGLGIIVQSSYQAIASGITQISPSSLNIQATWGDELALHQGEVLGDFYRVNRSNGQLETAELGHKIIAYRLKSSRDGLERQLLDEEAQKNYALTNVELHKLIELSFTLVAEYSNLDSFHWTLTESELSTFYLTNLKPYLTYYDKGLILKGLGASPGEAIAPAQIITTHSQNQPQILGGEILVLNSITLEWLPHLKQAAGIILEKGGLTSHGAIVARELGIPAIVGAKQATHLIKTGEFIKIDGETGEVHPAFPRDIQSQVDVKTFLPTYPLGTQLLVNISQKETLVQISGLPIDGVGLLRSELFFGELLQTRPLLTWLRQYKSELQAKLLALLEPVSRVFSPKPVFYRSLNWYALELESYLEPLQRETKIRQEFFSLELQTLLNLRKQLNYNINLLLPFVRSVEEFQDYYQQVKQIGLLHQESFQIWIMAEIPSVIFMLPEYVAAGVQGISIGTNDLSQFLLGINRDKSYIPPELTVKHPAIKKAIKQLIESAKQNNIPCSICGQLPVDYPEIIPDLIRWGIQSISVEPRALEKTYWAIARAEQSILLEMARKMK
ncbi:putative PEP-binding protein [Gloeocapsa sp. PCC 73106]|uniref:putative PEP-binding protein n=1 Tax=Gloeocapsa sp. PCC 73106 TaxID=102232 RepID=UPI0002AC4A6C|nr:putative PEP-binding protein [Gloeocapsa sp. PCC 73106]ELR99408.1 phosphoenolpyruvate synthase/pyruvate phosphate dikinase [Gloeocapsa sp. PCC 73106]